MVLDFFNRAVEPLAEMVDELHTSDDERNRFKQVIFTIQNKMAAKVLDYESQLMEAQAKVITAEAQGASWLQRSWRPITMLTFLLLVVADTFGMTTFRLAEEAWTLLQIGLGGYVVGRSAEKVLPKVTEIMRQK